MTFLSTIVKTFFPEESSQVNPAVSLNETHITLFYEKIKTQNPKAYAAFLERLQAFKNTLTLLPKENIESFRAIFIQQELALKPTNTRSLPEHNITFIQAPPAIRETPTEYFEELIISPTDCTEYLNKVLNISDIVFAPPTKPPDYYDFDELPDLARQNPKELLSSLLKGSTETLIKLETYAKNNHKRTESISKISSQENSNLIDSETTENYFQIDDLAYFFTQDQWQEIHAIISDCPNLATLKGTLRKQPDLLRNLRNKIETNVTKLLEAPKTTYGNKYYTIYSSFTSSLIATMILKCLNFLVLSHYTKGHKFSTKEHNHDNKDSINVPFSHPYRVVCHAIGGLLGNTFMQRLLNISDAPITSVYDKRILREPDTKKQSSLFSIKKLNTTTLNDFVNKIALGEITMESYQQIFGLTVTDPDLFEYLNANLFLDSLTNFSLKLKDPVLHKETFEAVVNKFHFQLGSIFVSTLIDTDIQD